MIKLNIKSRLAESGPSGVIENNFGVYAAQNDVTNYILVDMNALASLVDKLSPGMPIKSNLLTKDALFNAGVVAGGLELSKASELMYGPCMDAFNVNGSVMRPDLAGKGLGKYMYKLAMGYVGAPIIPDRSNVSKSAQRVWGSLERDAGVKKDFKIKYYGDSDKPKVFTVSKLDTADETPPPADNCDPTSTKNAPEFLNRAYQTRALKGENKKLIDNLKKFVASRIQNPGVFYTNLIAANNKLFSTQLGKG